MAQEYERTPGRRVAGRRHTPSHLETGGKRTAPPSRGEGGRTPRRRRKQKSSFGPLLYVIFVIGVSALLAAGSWVAAGDLLALNKSAHTATITLEKEGKRLTGVCAGDGPIDAAFLAIEQIIGHHYELDDFQIQAVTEGREAMGSALVKLRADGKLYSGNGISTDVIGASIRAYISALNKIVYEEA